MTTWRWVPHLRIILTTRSLLSKTDQGDVDVGGHFRNFRTHPDERPYVGAQIYRNDAGAQFEECEIGRFNVLHFGGLPSPYLAAWMDGHKEISMQESPWAMICVCSYLSTFQHLR